MSECRIVPSPVALLTERARMMREEVAVGHLRLMKQRDRQPLPERWRPLMEIIRRDALSTAITWIEDRELRPIAEIQLEDITLQSAPPVRYLEEDDRLHSTGGSAVEWPDGTKLFCLRGVPIPSLLYKKWQSGKLKPQALLQERNQSVMSVLLEQMDLAELLTADGVVAQVLDHDERWGTLRTLSWGPNASFGRVMMTVVEVVNRSPEPDGSFRHYWLQVDTNCRPILKVGFGQPQALTALNAVASTFAMTGEKYRKTLGKES